MRWEDGVRYEPDMRWGYLGLIDQARDIQLAGAFGCTVSRTNSLMRRAHGPAENEISPIGNRSPVPTPGIERPERRWNNVMPEEAPINSGSVSKSPPPSPPVRESRPATPERVEDNQRGRLNGDPEDSATNTQTGAGKDSNGKSERKRKSERRRTNRTQDLYAQLCEKGE